MVCIMGKSERLRQRDNEGRCNALMVMTKTSARASKQSPPDFPMAGVRRGYQAPSNATLYLTRQYFRRAWGV